MDSKALPREKAEDLSNDLLKFSSLSTYINGLNELSTETMNLASKSYEEIEKLFYERAVLFQQTFGINAAHKFRGQNFYRVRMNIGEEEDINLTRTYSYPPPSSCKNNGRANLKGKSVFYCSNHALTSVIESKPTAGQIGYLSVWQGNTERDVKYGICLPRDLRSENEFQFMANDVHKLVDENSMRKAGDKADHFRFFHQFVAERFVNESFPYPLTSWIANEMLYTDISRDFIIYPSIANDTYSCNMAFHPNSADALLKFKKVLSFRVEKFDGKQLAISRGRIGELDYSAMKWRKATEDDLSNILGIGTILSDTDINLK